MIRLARYGSRPQRAASATAAVIFARGFSARAGRWLAQDQYPQQRVGAATLLNFQPATPGGPSVADVAGFVETAQASAGFSAQSVLLVATPGFAAPLVDYVTGSSGSSDNAPQVVVGAVVDSLAYGAQRSGLSALLFSNEGDSDEEDGAAHIRVKEAIRLQSEEEQQRGALGKPSVRGVMTARNPWTLPEAYLSVSIPTAGTKDTSVSVPLANTIFESGVPTTLVYRAPASAEAAGEGGIKRRTQPTLGAPAAAAPAPTESLANTLLSSVHIELPFFSRGALATRSVAPVTLLTTGGPHTITDCKSNMIKAIDGKSAAGFLESCVALMDPHRGAEAVPQHAPERKVFAAITRDAAEGGVTPEITSRYEVIAGGGGSWSARSRMLVVDPAARPAPGDRVAFYMAEAAQLYDAAAYAAFLESHGVLRTPAAAAGAPVRVVLECAPVLESVEALEGRSGLVGYAPNTLVPGLFALGSEQGFLVGDAKHSVPGEILEIEN